MSSAPDLATTTWRALADATSRRTPFTLAWVATQHPVDGPQVRAMILRGVDRSEGSLRFATDVRSRKREAIAHDPRVAVTVHDPDAGIQVRLSGRADDVVDPRARELAWASLPARTRADFGRPTAPGAPLHSPGAAADPDDRGFDRFVWLRVTVDRVDHLDLSRVPHRRHLMRREDGWTAEPVQP